MITTVFEIGFDSCYSLQWKVFYCEEKFIILVIYVSDLINEDEFLFHYVQRFQQWRKN